MPASVHKFTVIPRLPKRLHKLLDIANNLWWCWNPDAIALFIRVDRSLWEKLQQNPHRILGAVSQSRLENLAKDDSFLAHMDRVAQQLEEYLSNSSWRARNPTAPDDFCVSYMSAEFGLHESVRIYSGGLGVLAGDHLKAASDLGLPLIAFGLLYRQGYFSQYLNADGWQQENYPRNDFYNMPIELMRDEVGDVLTIEVEYPGRMVKARLWRCQVGRVPLYLLDADLEENSPEDRVITDKLYGGDHETRVRQEILLGMGGVIALHKLGVHPMVYHMNEGHSAFMALQRIKEVVLERGLTFEQAIETVKAGSIFTTHTPVPAGNDMFEPGLISHYFAKYCKDVGISMDCLLGLGRQNVNDPEETFCMTVLALKLASGANGVSKLHGEVARGMWKGVWPDLPVHEVPITSITNGIHTRTWISNDMADLFDRYLGPGWINSPDDQSIWTRVNEIPDTELWRTHERRRERMVDFARKRLHKQYENRGAPASALQTSLEVLDPEALTIGFARRFATYKRATLLLHDRARLKRILLNKDRPVQFIIAGKAHPADQAGKQLIRELVHFGLDPEVRKHFIFVEDYDMNVARYLVQGVDVWLNTPRRPMEASGTSGMKAAANGALNISIPDGWWCEAEHLGKNGWSIGRGEGYESLEEQDAVESEALYEILEHGAVPMFYNRGQDNIPREWIASMKDAIRTIGPVFNTYRMVQEYSDRFYLPCSLRRQELFANKRKRAFALTEWKQRVHEAWKGVKVLKVESGPTEDLPVGTPLEVTATCELGKLTNKDVTAEIFYGDLDPEGRIPIGKTREMECINDGENDIYVFRGAIECLETGQQGYAVRVIPSHPDLAQKHEMPLITWA